METEQDNNQKYIIVATLAFIIGFGLSWLILTNKNADCNNDGVGENTPEATENISGSATSTTESLISVSDQVAGTEVTLNNVTLGKESWVVIHEDDNGKPGRILGAQLFDAGNWSGKVELLRGTLAGGYYYAMIHDDNGDRAFDPKKDLPLTTQSGEIAMKMFRVTAE